MIIHIQDKRQHWTERHPHITACIIGIVIQGLFSVILYFVLRSLLKSSG